MVKERAAPGRPLGSHSPLNFDRINQALSEGVPATLTPKEVKAITGYTGTRLYNEIRAGTFPAPINPEKHSWRVWASVDIRDWLVENGLPTVFGKAAQS